MRDLEFGPVDQLRMKSGQIAVYTVVAQPANPPGFSSVKFTQGQQPNTPAGQITEFSVSRCPGVIQTAVPNCYVRSNFVNQNDITIWTKTKPEWGWVDQASIPAGYGCMADSSQGTMYVNVRWTYPTCNWGENACGSSMQWAVGAW